MNGHGDEKRGHLGRLLRWALSPAYYWLDLYGTDGRPSSSKLLWTGAIVTLLAAVVLFGLEEARRSTGLSLYFVIFAFGVLAAAGGQKSFKEFLRLRAGGLTDAAGEHERNRASQTQATAVLETARASIAQRRQVGREDGIEPT